MKIRFKNLAPILGLAVVALSFLFSSPAVTQSPDPDIAELSLEDELQRANTGARKIPEEDYLKIEQAKMLRSFSAADGALFRGLPATVDLSTEFPAVGDQGRQGSCAGWSVGYAVKSFQENREHGWGFSKDHVFSPSFLYNQANEGVDEGAYMVDVMKLLKESGSVPITMMPYNDRDFRTQPSEETKAFAKNFRALDYRRLVKADPEMIKAYLAAGDPVVFEMMLYTNFFTSGMRRNKNIYGAAEGREEGYHFIVAVGYDDSKRAFKLMNSWGPRWGDKGYGWLTYDFFATVVPRAYVIYDLPTPATAVSYLTAPGTVTTKTPQMATQTVPVPQTITDEMLQTQTPPNTVTSLPPPPITAVQISPNVPQGEPLVIIPEEAGVTLSGQWLRLAEPLKRQEEFFSEKTSPRFQGFNFQGDDVRVTPLFTGEDTIGKMHFLAANRVPVATNLGVTFKTPKSEVHRIYRAPDHVYAADKSESYFYHALSENWGGVKVTKHATLTFYYDNADLVDRMTLQTVFKQAFTGTGFTSMTAAEENKTAAGTAVDSAEGAVRFTVPPAFSEIKKSVWPGTGVGYFITNPTSPAQVLTVKVFNAADGATADVLNERIPVDLKSQNATGGKPLEAVNFGGVTWQLAASTSDNQLRYYSFHGGKIYQIYVFADAPARNLDWVQAFLNSFAFK